MHPEVLRRRKRGWKAEVSEEGGDAESWLEAERPSLAVFVWLRAAGWGRNGERDRGMSRGKALPQGPRRRKAGGSSVSCWPAWSKHLRKRALLFEREKSQNLPASN